jgi:hypothetical protein
MIEIFAVIFLKLQPTSRGLAIVADQKAKTFDFART